MTDRYASNPKCILSYVCVVLELQSSEGQDIKAPMLVLLVLFG